MFYGMLLVIGATAAVGDLLVYRWARTHQGWSLAAGLVSWIASLVLFGLLLRGGERSLSVTFILAMVVHTAIVLGWDLLVSRNNWSRLEWAGIVLAVAGILLIELGRHGTEPGE